MTKVEPSSDSERDDDQHLVLGKTADPESTQSATLTLSLTALRDSATIFTDKVRELVESLQVSILTYQSVATRKQAGSNAFRAMYMPTIKISENVAAGKFCWRFRKSATQLTRGCRPISRISRRFLARHRKDALGPTC